MEICIFSRNHHNSFNNENCKFSLTLEIYKFSRFYHNSLTMGKSIFFLNLSQFVSNCQQFVCIHKSFTMEFCVKNFLFFNNGKFLECFIAVFK